MELVKNLKTTDDAVEIWAKQVMNFCHNEMSQKQSEAFISLIINEKEFDENKEIDEFINDNKKGGYSYVLIQRCKSLGLTIKNSVAFFLGCYVAKSFGECTMISAYLKYKSHVENVNVIDMTFLSEHCFPFGFPNDKQWSELWDSQKVERNHLSELRKKFLASDNILDYKNTYNTLN